jgi:hypothetical protein
MSRRRMTPFCSAYYLVCFQKGTDGVKDFVIDGIYRSDGRAFLNCC